MDGDAVVVEDFTATLNNLETFLEALTDGDFMFFIDDFSDACERRLGELSFSRAKHGM